MVTWRGGCVGIEDGKRVLRSAGWRMRAVEKGVGRAGEECCGGEEEGLWEGTRGNGREGLRDRD